MCNYLILGKAVLVIVYIKWESLDITYYLNYSLHM